MKHPLIAACIPAACLLIHTPLRAAETTVHFTSGETIPDDDTTGLADNRIVHSGITQLTEVEVHLEIAGGWNGDLYAHLVHEDGYAVLLNRSGRTESSDAGSPASGFDITLSDNAVTDVHLVESAGTVTGLLQPAARDVNPQLAYDTSARTEYLSSFQGLPASGEWTLFLVDAAGGNVSTLVSWGLTLRGTGTPQSFYGEWAAGLTGDDADPDASPQGDGLKNLLKYAFNLNALSPDARRLVFGASGKAGLPAQQVVRAGSTVSITVEYLRRRDSGLIYTPMRSPDMSPLSFVPMSGAETVETIDANWERVRLTEILDAASFPRMFCTVEVVFP
jgi:subtilisin-like proprotein convertase family protein